MNSIVPENRQKRPNWRRGVPNGNRNALKHGRHTKEARALRACVRDFKHRVRIALALIEEKNTVSSQRGR